MTNALRMEFPAIRGTMGSRSYYVAMLPLGIIPRLFSFAPPELPAEQRAQRRLNKKRVPEIAKYILDHEEDWLFSSLTASYQADEVFNDTDISPDIGVLQLPLDTKFLINDGQHRRAAIEEALKGDPSLENQTISVVLFPEESLERSQQMFSDLNRTVHKTSRSLDILYDHRDPMNEITLAVAGAVELFRNRVEKNAVSISVRSPKFVTLSSLYDANVQLVGKPSEQDVRGDDTLAAEAERQAIEYWSSVAERIEQWRLVQNGDMRPSEVRTDFICSHAVCFWALGGAGRALLAARPDRWQAGLDALREINWHKTNAEWQGICMLGTDIVTRRQTKQAMTKYLQWKLGLVDKKPAPVLDVEANGPK